MAKIGDHRHNHGSGGVHATLEVSRSGLAGPEVVDTLKWLCSLDQSSKWQSTLQKLFLANLMLCMTD